MQQGVLALSPDWDSLKVRVLSGRSSSAPPLRPRELHPQLRLRDSAAGAAGAAPAADFSEMEAILMAELTDKRLFLLDMDGTLYLDDDLFPGTVPFLRRIREKGGRYLFLTNNSSRGADSYVEKLRRLGIESVPEDFLTSVDALILFLRKGDYQGKPLYVAGTESFPPPAAERGVFRDLRPGGGGGPHLRL